MRFFDRENEIAELRRIREMSHETARFTVLTGRRRVGKGRYSRIGGWWDRKGENEIDLVCENEFRNTLEFVEVKRNPERIDLDALRLKAEAFLQKNPDRRGREISYAGWSLEDM